MAENEKKANDGHMSMAERWDIDDKEGFWFEIVEDEEEDSEKD